MPGPAGPKKNPRSAALAEWGFFVEDIAVWRAFSLSRVFERCADQPIRFLTTSATGLVNRATSTVYIAKLPTASLM